MAECNIAKKEGDFLKNLFWKKCEETVDKN